LSNFRKQLFHADAIGVAWIPTLSPELLHVRLKELPLQQPQRPKILVPGAVGPHLLRLKRETNTLEHGSFFVAQPVLVLSLVRRPCAQIAIFSLFAIELECSILQKNKGEANNSIAL
jgi:hypothetical protein